MTTLEQGPPELEQRVIKAIRGSIPPPLASTIVRADHRLREDLGLDSLGLMTLAFRLEDEFALQLAEHTDALRGAVTVEQLIKLVSSLHAR